MGGGFGFDEDVLGAHFSGFARSLERVQMRFGFSKVFLGECVIGLEADRGLKVIDGVFILPQFEVRTAHVIVRIGKIGFVADGFFVLWDGVSIPPFISVEQAEVVVHVGVVGFELESLIVAGFGFPVIASHGVDSA